MKRLTILIVLSMLPAAASAEEPTEATPLIQYEYTRGRAYAKVAVTILSDNTANVHVVRNTAEPPIDYSTELSQAEAAWFLLVLRSTDFANPDRLERQAAGGDGGITSIRASFDGLDLQAKFGRDDAFEDLSHNLFRLVRQAELIARLQRDDHAYEIRSGLTDRRVLQPAAFVEPLMNYIHRETEQLDHALVALALIATPEQWGGFLAKELELASDAPLREDSALSRRQLMLNVITNHPFFLDLPDSHNDALIRVYRAQSTIESAKTGDDPARHVRLFKENEERMKRSQKP